MAEVYEYCLTYYNLPTASLTAALCGGAGNFAAQLRNQQGNNHSNYFCIDWKENRVFCIKGMIGGVIWSQWYNFLDPIAASAVAVAPRGSLQLCRLSRSKSSFAQLFLIFALYEIPFPMMMRGDPIDQIPVQVRDKLGSVLLENAKVWTVANLLVYSVSLQWRVLISGIAEVVWQMLLAQLLAADQQKPVDVYLPLARATEQEQQAVRLGSVVDRIRKEPAAVEQR